MEQELNRRWSAVFADEHGGMIGAVAEFRLVRVLAARPAERFDACFAVGASHPPIAGTEAELRQLGGFLDRVDRRHQRRRVHPVAWLARFARRKNFGHGLSSCSRHHGGSHL